MPDLHTVKVPDIGDAENVEVVEILVAPGDAVAVDDSLVTLESDKATMEIPSPVAGVVREVLVSLNDSVLEGTPLASVEVQATEAAEPEAEAATTREATPRPDPPAPAPVAAREVPEDDAVALPSQQADFDVVVVGGGPGGYTAAFRAADLGLRVALVERYARLGGVCLNVGCIPSKTLLHVAEVIAEAQELAPFGVAFGEPKLDFAKLRKHKDDVVAKLTGGLSQLAKQRKVEVIRGEARFSSPYTLDIAGEGGTQTVRFQNAIVAVGSRPTMLPDLPEDPRVVDSTGALEVDESVRRILVIGGGIIGLEMAAVYDALGARVTVVELLPELISEADRDLVKPLQRRIEARYEAIHLGVKVTRVEALPEALRVYFEGEDAPEPQDYDRVLVAVGRRPNGDRIGAEHAGLEVDERGFLPADASQRTNVAHIYAIGDVAGNPMLAHKATHEGVVAAEVIAGLPAASDARAIPGVAYTDPEVAWTGLSEREARERGIEVEKAIFPWAASGRALSIGRSEGLTRLLFSKEDGRLLGAGIVGPSAGDLIAEATLAIELGADAEDLALTIHPHPTLAETVGFAGEAGAGTITDLYLPKRTRKRAAGS